MADKEKKKHENKSVENQTLENKSLEELHKQIEKGKRKISRSFVFAVAALIAIVAIGIAWFVSNTKVSAIGARISADNPISFELGSTGTRSSEEQTYLKDPALSDGTSKRYDFYVDANTGKKVNGNIELKVGNSNLAWYLNDQTKFWPSANGTFEFYIIPRQDNLTTVTVTLEIEAYTESGTDANKTAQKITGDKASELNALLSGHILLFRGLDDKKGYSRWIEVPESGNLTITINASDMDADGKKLDNSSDTQSGTASFIKDKPYKVTLYWVWPKYFRNYIYDSRNAYGDLFTDTTNNDDYSKLLTFVQNPNNKNKLFYGTADDDKSNEIKADMDDTVFNKWSSYYDLADEQIGNNVTYVHINLTVQ